MKGTAASSRGGKGSHKGKSKPRLVETDLSEGVDALGLATPSNADAREHGSPDSVHTTGSVEGPCWEDIRKQKKLKGRVGNAGNKVTLYTNRLNILELPKKISVFHFAFTDAEGKDSSQKVDITGKLDIVNNPLAYDGSKILVQYGPIQEGKKSAHDDGYVMGQLGDMINANNSRLKLDSKEDISLGSHLKSVHLQYLNIIFTRNLPSATYESLPRRQGGGRGGRGRGRGGGRGFGNRPDVDVETLDIRYRYRTAMKYGETGPQLSLDVQGGIVYKEMPFLDFLKKRGLFRNGQLDFRRAERDTEKLRLIPTHRKGANAFTVKGISKEPVSRLSFKDKDGKTATVLSYFKQTFPNVMLNPNYPCIRASSRRSIFYPLEVLYLVKEQSFKGEIPRSAISSVHLAPQQRNRLISNGFKSVSELVARTSGGEHKLGKEMLKVTGREIGSINVRKGQKFHIPKAINKWVVLIADNRANPKDIATTIRSFITAGGSYGMRIAKPMNSNPLPIRFGRELEPTLSPYVKQGLEFVLLIKSEQDKFLYNAAKEYSWIKTGIPIQVCLSKHFRNAQENRLRSYMGNLLLKVNIKMGGSNFKFTQGIRGLPSRNTLVLGMDVSHGMLNVTGAEKLPNLATIGLIAFDPGSNKFRSTYGSQAGRSDIIEPGKMTQLLHELKINFKKFDSIIFYRDGVGESMFHLVERSEFLALRNLVGANVKITFLVFNKRHRTRFFKYDNGRFDNPNAGTVVDTVVTNKGDYDFFLQAHRCGIGSANLPHYIVLHDDHKFAPDDLQGVTNQLSSLYQRSFGPVSQTCTSYYAHILADKCRFLLDAKGNLPILNERLLKTSHMYFL